MTFVSHPWYGAPESSPVFPFPVFILLPCRPSFKNSPAILLLLFLTFFAFLSTFNTIILPFFIRLLILVREASLLIFFVNLQYLVLNKLHGFTVPEASLHEFLFPDNLQSLALQAHFARNHPHFLSALLATL